MPYAWGIIGFILNPVLYAGAFSFLAMRYFLPVIFIPLFPSMILLSTTVHLRNSKTQNQKHPEQVLEIWADS
jgi:hypothetical protein